MKLTMIFVLFHFFISYLINCLLKNFDSLLILEGTTCALFISRYCIDSWFSTSKGVEGFLQNIFKSVNEKLNLLHKVL